MNQNPWESIETALGEAEGSGLAEVLESLSPSDLARAISHLSEDDRQSLLGQLRPEESADLLELLPAVQAAGLVNELSATQAAAILNELPSHEQVQVLSEVGDRQAEEILAEMPAGVADTVRDLRAYSEDEAGSLLVLEPTRAYSTWTVKRTLERLRSKANAALGAALYLYVVDRDQRLVGVVPLRQLVFADPASVLSELMVEPISITDHQDLDSVAELFQSYGFLALPVVDDAGRLLGTIDRSELGRERAEQEQEQWLETQGIVGGEELRSLPYLLRSRRRLSWLSVNVVLNLIAASVIGYYQDTLASVLALAMFLPIISDMSGCSGNQAVAVSLRELSLGVVKPADLLFVLRKELVVGILNGIALGLLLGAVAWVWQGSPYLGLVVGGALAVNTVVAVCLGGAVPLALTRAGYDPALASGPILTTVTDMCGFFLALSFATAMLAQLTS